MRLVDESRVLQAGNDAPCWVRHAGGNGQLLTVVSAVSKWDSSPHIIVDVGKWQDFSATCLNTQSNPKRSDLPARRTACQKLLVQNAVHVSVCAVAQCTVHHAVNQPLAAYLQTRAFKRAAHQQASPVYSQACRLPKHVHSCRA